MSLHELRDRPGQDGSQQRLELSDDPLDRGVQAAPARAKCVRQIRQLGQDLRIEVPYPLLQALHQLRSGVKKTC